jgi:hypothetical protein
MKKKKSIIIILLIIITFVSVYSIFSLIENSSQNNKETKKNYTVNNEENNDEDAEEEKISVKVISDFNQLLALNPSESELLNFIYLRGSSINDKTLNELIIKFINFQYEKLTIHDQMMQNENIQNELVRKFDKIITEDNLQQLNDLALKNKLMTLYRGGYSLEFNNGKYHININHNFFSQYEHRLSQEIKDFRIININLYNPNESINIQWQYIRQNITLTESFLNKYSESKLYPRIYSYYISNIDYILYGTDYIDIFTEADELRKDVKEAYKNIMLNNSKYYFKETFSTYYNELINNSFMINDSIENLRQELFQLNIEKYQKQ